MSNFDEAVQEMIDAGESRDTIVEYVKQHSDHTTDIGNLPKHQHNWVRRGIKLSCEGAGHPHHSHFLFKR